MPFSIVIPALNEERYLPLLLQSIADTGIEGAQVIVVDGKSDDATQQRVREFAEAQHGRLNVELHEADKRNVGYQRNLGGSKATHDTLVFLDSDTLIPDRATLESLLADFRAEACAAASCRFEPIKRHPLAVAYYEILYRFQRFQQKRNPYAMGACIITRKDVFDRINGFDETIRVNEDAEYCQRAAQHGPFRIFPQAIKVSTRRFDKEGYFKMGTKYVRLFLDRSLRGELRDDHIEYKFGHYDS
ncbi:MAG TPA: glycosyltransferase [Verrucomicrobiae bacterium]|nr:glycosyltransferase [Verrucomicrobiae bacterium]